MDFMDLLLADALAAGLARQAAREAQRPPPDNFFILPPDPSAWRKLYEACNKEHMVICIEITDDNHAPSRRVQPLIVDLAREISQIPFFRVKVGFGRTYDQLRRDLGGVQYIPTVIIVFFDDDDVRIKKAEGEEEIKLALRIGAFEKIIKDFIDQRVKIKVAEKLVEHLVAGAVADDLARKRREASLEYEQKLKREREEIEAKEKAKEREQERLLEEERQKRIEAEKRAEEAKRNEQKAKLKAYVADELMQMDLKKAKISLIKEKMQDLGISDAGCLSREDLITRLKSNIPSLKAKLDQSSDQNASDFTPSSYVTTNRQSSYTDSSTDSSSSLKKDISQDEVTRLERRIKNLEGNIDDLDSLRSSLETKNSELELKNRRLESQLKEKDDSLRQKNRELESKDKEIMELKKTQGGIGLFRRQSDSGKVTELQDELIETRLLYSCTLDDLDIVGLIARNAEGAIMRAKCIKAGTPNPSRVYAVKMVNDVMGTSTLSTVRAKYKTEYDILSGLPPHKNIIHLYAFFYDRPKVHPKLKDSCGDGVGLFMLMELLSQSMKSYLDVIRKSTGPNATKVIGWLKDLLCGLEYLYSHHIVHRDLKLENLLLSGNTLKIADFGIAIRLDSTMALQFQFAMTRGGNEAHLAPEILNVRPAPGRSLVYTKQPVWAAGVLAYELAGHESPFKKVDQRAYDVSSIPCLSSTYCQGSGKPQVFPPEITNLVESMIQFDPEKRPTLSKALERVSKLV